MDAAALCCRPMMLEPLSERDAEQLASAFKALADPVRLRLLSLIANSPGAEACVCDLVEPAGRSQPTVSHHLGLLAEAGLVSRSQRGRWAWYRADPERIAALREALSVG